MKTAYYHSLLEINKNNMEKICQILNEALGKLNDKSSFRKNFIVNNKNVDNKTEITNGFNSYFTGTGNAREQKIPKLKQHFSTFFAKSWK